MLADLHTLSLHDALPISSRRDSDSPVTIYDVAEAAGVAPSTVSRALSRPGKARETPLREQPQRRSEEHTSELQSRGHLVCRLLLEKKKDEKLSVEITASV